MNRRIGLAAAYLHLIRPMPRVRLLAIIYRDASLHRLRHFFTPETLAHRVRDVIEDRAQAGAVPAG